MTKKTIIWLLILICLGGFVYYHEIVGGKKRQKAQDNAQKIFNFSLENVSEIKLEQQTKIIRCVKTSDSVWQMVEPLETPADKSAIDTLIASILTAQIERVVETNAQALEPYGLNNPSLQATLISNNKTYKLLLGKENPTKEFLYAKRANNNKIFLLPTEIRSKLSKNVYAVRNKQIIKAQAKQVSQLRLEYPGTTILLAQNPATGWQMLEPIKAKADNKQIGELVYILDGVHAQKFITEKASDLTQYGLDKPQAVIDLTMHDNTHQILLLGKNEGPESAIYAKQQTQDPIFTLPKQTGEFLIKNVFSLRDKYLLYFLPTEISKLELSNSKQSMVLRHSDDNTWVVIKPETAVAEATFIELILKTIAKTQAKEFIDQQTPRDYYGLNNPTILVKLWLKDGTTQTLTVGNKKIGTDLVYAKARGQISLIEAKAAEHVDYQISILTGAK